MADEATRKAVSQIPLLKTHAGPRDRALWPQRLKEEYQALIKFVEQNKAADNDWFRLESNPEGTRWTGMCWFIHEIAVLFIVTPCRITVLVIQWYVYSYHITACTTNSVSKARYS
uniref:Ubiquitin-fold modifier-conjugating enzyme 1 n=1 Tax=Cynoglossus semilaevis TaxID=244447 RepID=A0A3P8WYI7_CYNSE